MVKETKLETYTQKRNFSKTPEPQGRSQKGKLSKFIFVVQKHDASHLHYDFRLEMNGVLKSWAIPKGPSLDHKDKRLAIETEDHPFDYKDFEGIIPKGQYGGGTVLIWDEGTYESTSDSSSILESYIKGHLGFTLHGKRLKGNFVLHRITTGKNHWLFIKQKDKYDVDNYDIDTFNTSVVSHKTLKEIEKG